MEPYYYQAHLPLSFGAKTRLLPKDWWLKSQVYTLHKPIKRRFPTRATLTSAPHVQYQADLIEMIPYSRENHGNKYILVVIDIFSRRLWTFPLKDKTGPQVAEAFKTLFKQTKKAPLYLQTDHGKEFYNQYVRQVLTKHKVQLFSTQSVYKAALAERVNRTIKTRLWRYFTFTGHHKWITVLPQLTDSYNNTPHSSLPKLTKHHLTPMEVDEGHWHSTWTHQEQRGDPPTHQPKFGVGDHVRISRWKGVFEKGFTTNFTKEIFQVAAVDQRQTPVMYQLKDAQGELIDGKFYAQEMQRVIPPDEEEEEEIPRIRRQRRPPTILHRPFLTKTKRATAQQAITRLYDRPSSQRQAKQAAIQSLYKQS
jgi:hypothetical protein